MIDEKLYSAAYDKAMTEKFPGHTFKTRINWFIGNFDTLLDGNPEKDFTNEMMLYGRGFSEGYLAAKLEAEPKKCNIAIKQAEQPGWVFIEIDGVPDKRRDGEIALHPGEKSALDLIKHRGYESCKMLDGSVWNKEPKR